MVSAADVAIDASSLKQKVDSQAQKVRDLKSTGGAKVCMDYMVSNHFFISYKLVITIILSNLYF